MKLLEITESFFAEKNSAIAKDLKLNFKKITEGNTLEPKEKALLVLSLAKASHLDGFFEAALHEAKELQIPEEQIQEAIDTAALMGMLNSYYRFKDFLHEGASELSESYKNAGLRMNVFSTTKLGKVLLESLSFAHSIVNGCKYCTLAHEKVLRTSGWPAEKIHDVARLASVIKGISVL